MTGSPSALQLLLTGYLHQDWTWDYVTPEDAVAHFIGSEPRETVRSAQSEVAELLDQRSDQQTAAWLDQSGCGYHPPADQLSAAGWLRRVDEQLRHALAGDALWRP